MSENKYRLSFDWGYTGEYGVGWASKFYITPQIEGCTPGKINWSFDDNDNAPTNWHPVGSGHQEHTYWAGPDAVFPAPVVTCTKVRFYEGWVDDNDSASWAPDRGGVWAITTTWVDPSPSPGAS